MLTPLILALSGVTTLSMGLLVWLLWSRPQSLSWAGSPSWSSGLLTRLGERTRRRLSSDVALQAEVLQIPSHELIGMGLGVALLVGLGVAALFPVRWLGILAALAAFYIGPSFSVRRRFKAYQQALRLGFETQVLLLRIYFDLGQSVTTAFRTMRTALHGYTLAEVDRLLGDLAQGQGDAAFKTWAGRTQLDEYRLLADTIVQQRGRALRGDALDSLDTLLTANRQQSMKTLTDRLTGGGALVPILATLSVTTLYLYALMSHIQGLGSLNFKL